MSEYPTLWFWRSDETFGAFQPVMSFSTNEHPHPSTVESNAKPTEANPFSIITPNDKLVSAWVDTTHIPKAPPLWYVYLPQSELTSLIAMPTDDFADGTIVTPEQFRSTDLSISEQVGAIQWNSKTATLQNIYVHKDHRRMGISTKMINVADIIVVSTTKDVYLNGGAHLTDNGAELAKKWSHSKRLSERQGYYSPMDKS